MFVHTCVVPTSEVVGCIFFATDELLGVEKLPVGASAHFVHHCGLQVDV